MTKQGSQYFPGFSLGLWLLAVIKDILEQSSVPLEFQFWSTYWVISALKSLAMAFWGCLRHFGPKFNPAWISILVNILGHFGPIITWNCCLDCLRHFGPKFNPIWIAILVNTLGHFGQKITWNGFLGLIDTFWTKFQSHLNFNFGQHFGSFRP